MKKIHCFIASLAGGGAEHQIAVLSELLSEEGYDVTLVTYNDIPDHYNLPSAVKRIRLNVRGNRIMKQIKIMKYLITIKTDCLISFREQMNFIALWAMMFRPFVKVIAGERNFTIGQPTRYLWWNMKLLYRRANYIVPNNYSQENYLIKHAPHLKNKIHTIINYTDLHSFFAIPLPPFNEVTYIGVFARFFPQKNYRRFAYAVKKLKELNSVKFKIVWFGTFYEKDGSEKIGYKEMREIVNDLDITDVLELRNSVKNVHKEITYFHALCLPSLYEGFSNSIAEGICSGRPMLVSNVSDNSIMVKEGVNGFLFNPTSEDEIVTALLNFINLTYQQKVDMGNKSRDIAETLFDRNNFVNSYIKLIEQ